MQRLVIVGGGIVGITIAIEIAKKIYLKKFFLLKRKNL